VSYVDVECFRPWNRDSACASVLTAANSTPYSSIGCIIGCMGGFNRWFSYREGGFNRVSMV
jgi:hypothetical protein